MILPLLREGSNIDSVIDFLNLVSSVPQIYREGDNRVLLLRAVFQNCHHILALKKSRTIAKLYRSTDITRDMERIPHSDKQLFIEIRTLSLLNEKFKSVDDILHQMASLPEIEEPIEIQEQEVPVSPKGTLVEQLTDHDKTFHVGALIPHIWSGLNIPFHNMNTSEQPLGGVSDLTNKGDFDKLLISEFANDDLVFLNRIANNEALYIRREVPPENNNLERVILIDVSLRNWGTPKTVAYGIMLARRPRTGFVFPGISRYEKPRDNSDSQQRINRTSGRAKGDQ
jgi:hypothetical protein